MERGKLGHKAAGLLTNGNARADACHIQRQERPAGILGHLFKRVVFLRNGFTTSSACFIAQRAQVLAGPGQVVPALVSRWFLQVIVSSFLGLARALLPLLPVPAPTRDLPPFSVPFTPHPGSSQGGGFSSASAPIRAPRTGSASSSPAPRHRQPVEIGVCKVGPSNCGWAVRLERPAPAALGRCSAGGRAGASAFSERRRGASGSAGCVRWCGRRRRCDPGVLDEAEATRLGRKAPQARSEQARRGSRD